MMDRTGYIWTKGIKLAPFRGWGKTLSVSILVKQLVPLQKNVKINKKKKLSIDTRDIQSNHGHGDPTGHSVPVE